MPISDKAWRPTVAVIPFTAHTAAPKEAALGDILAGEIIAALSRRTDLNVVSHLSGTDLWRREARLQRLQGRIKADYLLSGAYRVAGKRLVLVAELVEVRSGHVVWGESLKSTVQKIMQGEDQITAEVAVQLGKHMGWSNIPPATGSALPPRHHQTALRSSLSDCQGTREVVSEWQQKRPQGGGLTHQRVGSFLSTVIRLVAIVM